MTISIYLPESTFTTDQVRRLKTLGIVRFTNSAESLSDDTLLLHAKDADILGLDPDNFGGFEKARARTMPLFKALPNLVGVALATTSFGWVDYEYLKKINIPVANVPGYSREAVAEHTIALLLSMAKRILLTDRRTQKGKYVKEMAFELAGKTLGIIGIGNIGSRTAELAQGLGMKVVAFNRSPKSYPGVTMVTLPELMKQADAIAIHVTHEDGNEGVLGAKELALAKKGVIVVNTADPGNVDEKAMADVMKKGIVDQYTCEGTLFEDSPLKGVEKAIGLKGFGYFTREAIANLYEIFVSDLEAIASGKPKNVVNGV
jgi:phosphoglycerate dehydrogenase-like enzyme